MNINKIEPEKILTYSELLEAFNKFTITYRIFSLIEIRYICMNDLSFQNEYDKYLSKLKLEYSYLINYDIPYGALLKEKELEIIKGYYYSE